MRAHETHYKFYRFLIPSKISYPKIQPQNKPNTLDRYIKLSKNQKAIPGICEGVLGAHKPRIGAVIPESPPFQVLMEKPACPKAF